VSIVGALLAVSALGAARSHAVEAQRRYETALVRLERKTVDLSTCEDLAARALHGD
jgi:hypothetical protein